MEIKARLNLQEELDPDYIARFVQTANQFESELYIQVEGCHTVSAKSIMGMINFLAGDGQDVMISAVGKDQEEAARALANLTAGSEELLDERVKILSVSPETAC